MYYILRKYFVQGEEVTVCFGFSKSGFKRTKNILTVFGLSEPFHPLPIVSTIYSSTVEQ